MLALIKPEFPMSPRVCAHAFASGLLVHVAYLGGVFGAIKLGLPAGITAIIVGMQPILTTLLFVTKGRLPSKVLFTSALGFAGLLFVIDPGSTQNSYHWPMLWPAVLALTGITFGTIYQKQKCSEVNVLSLAILQYIPTALIFIVLAYTLENGQEIMWQGELIFALLWLSIVLSIGAILLMNWLYKHQSATKAANFFYLAPPLALVQASLFFGETISAINGAGILLVVLSLYATSRVLGKA